MAKNDDHRWEERDGVWVYIPPGSTDPQSDIPEPYGPVPTPEDAEKAAKAAEKSGK